MRAASPENNSSVPTPPVSDLDRRSYALRVEVETLQGLDIHALRARWRQRLRSTPPATLTRPLLLRLLAYRMQARVYGDIDAATVRYLSRIARDHARRRDAGKERKSNVPPLVPPAPRERGLKPGTLLVREHDGTLHRVVVLAQGFSWQDTIFTSLSEIARQITGTRWNGPRFFGLRDKPAPDPRQRHTK